MDLNHLAVFSAVAASGGFSAAAKKLGVPKSSVSRAISSLENEMGVRLVHRTTRQVSLSTAGAALYERVASPLASLEASLGQMPEREEEPSGTLRVTASVDFGASVMADLVTRFLARYPHVQVEMHLTNEVVDLVAEGVDVAIRMTARLEDSSLVRKKAGSLAIHPYASPSYLARKGTPRTPDDLADHAWVVFRSIRSIAIDGPAASVKITPKGRLTCDEMSFMRQAVRAGAGIGFLPSFLVEEDVASGDVVRVLPKWSAKSGDFWIVWPSVRHVPKKVTAFRDFVLETMRARPLG